VCRPGVFSPPQTHTITSFPLLPPPPIACSCSINPARTFGVAAISGNWNDHWVFWFGPYLGATAAALCYTYLFQHELFHTAAKTTTTKKSSSSSSSSSAPASTPIKVAAPEAVEVATKGDSDLQEWK
jgi:hypothetical protein